jgi:hypothetical protein
MMSTVTPLAKVVSINLLNEEVVKTLRDLLVRAESGEIKSVMYLADRFDQTFDVAWTGCDDLVVLAGQAARLQYRIQIRMDGEAE